MKSYKKSFGRELPSFLHTTQDGTGNQPITHAEIEAKKGRRAMIVTGGKSTRKQRRKWDKEKKKK